MSEELKEDQCGWSIRGRVVGDAFGEVGRSQVTQVFVYFQLFYDLNVSDLKIDYAGIGCFYFLVQFWVFFRLSCVFSGFEIIELRVRGLYIFFFYFIVGILLDLEILRKSICFSVWFFEQVFDRSRIIRSLG